MPNGQFTLDRVLAVQTDVVLDPTVPGYDKEAADQVVYEVTEMMQAAGDQYDRAEVYTKISSCKEWKMTLDEFFKQMKHINQELDRIAQQTLQQAFAGCANESNPMFRELMKRHKELTDKAEKLINEAEQSQ